MSCPDKEEDPESSIARGILLLCACALIVRCNPAFTTLRVFGLVIFANFVA